jgi:hypothetical protein
MYKLKYLFKNVTVLNVLLIISLVFLASYSFLNFSKISIKYSPQAHKKALPDAERTILERQLPSPADYIIVSEQNILHPERRIPPAKKEEPPPLPKPDVVLYGTMISDGISIAYLEDLKAPRNTPGRGKRQLTMREGDIISGFVIKKIEADKIQMDRGQEEMVVSIHTHKETKHQGAPPPDKQAAAPQQPPQPQAAKPKQQNLSRKKIDQDVSEFLRKRATQ